MGMMWGHGDSSKIKKKERIIKTRQTLSDLDLANEIEGALLIVC